MERETRAEIVVGCGGCGAPLANVRRYSEYWTFIRSANARGASGKDPVCPNCGAPVNAINMAGECGSCRVDWVLSRIEQDEVYRL